MKRPFCRSFGVRVSRAKRFRFHLKSIRLESSAVRAGAYVECVRWYRKYREFPHPAIQALVTDEDLEAIKFRGEIGHRLGFYRVIDGLRSLWVSKS